MSEENQRKCKRIFFTPPPPLSCTVQQCERGGMEMGIRDVFFRSTFQNSAAFISPLSVTSFIKVGEETGESGWGEREGCDPTHTPVNALQCVRPSLVYPDHADTDLQNQDDLDQGMWIFKIRMIRIALMRIFKIRMIRIIGCGSC